LYAKPASEFDPGPGDPAVTLPSAESARPALIVHGGAWGIPEAEVADHLAGVGRAVEAGWRLLERGVPALDVVEEVVALLEDDPTFDAGIGAHLNGDGLVELDAGLMEGTALRAGAVAAVTRIRNPIRAARRILAAGEHLLLVGEGAERYAAGTGIPLCANEEMIIPRERERFELMKSGRLALTTPDPFAERHFGTVGAVALDRAGAMAAATSTGGSLFKTPGRVGDSPLPGCGFYADNTTAAVSTTGWGESIIRVQLARHAAELVAAGAVGPEAALRSVRYLAEKVGGWGGVILIDRAGWVGFAHNTPRMAFAWRTPEMAAAEVRIEVGEEG
jgi:L-asparaginase / beta-aspartyl-peptidase